MPPARTGGKPGRPRKQAAPPPEPEPQLQAEPQVEEAAAQEVEEQDPTRPHEHKGVAVIREQLRSNLPSGAPYKISILHLEDGTKAHACRDCLFTGDTMTEVRHHRNEEHGARFGKRPPKVRFEKDGDVLDLALPPRADRPAPTNPLEMTLAEVLSLAPSYAALADLIDRMERERDAALDKLAELMASNKDAQHALAVYPTLQQEVVELRLMVRNAGTYEELKAEVTALRAFKKKTLTRFESMGFAYVEEDTKEH